VNDRIAGLFVEASGAQPFAQADSRHAWRSRLCSNVEPVEKVSTRSHTGKIRLGSVRLMNLDIEAEQGHDRGTETLFVTETRTSCRDFEDRSVIRISRKSPNLGVFLQPR